MLFLGAKLAEVLHIDTCLTTNIRSKHTYYEYEFDEKIKSAQNLNSAGTLGNRREQLTRSFARLYIYHVAVLPCIHVTFNGMLNNNSQVINRFLSNSDCCVNYLYGAQDRSVATLNECDAMAGNVKSDFVVVLA